MAKGNALIVGSEFSPDFEFLAADKHFHLTGAHFSYPAGMAPGGPFCPSPSPVDDGLYVWYRTGDLLKYNVDTLGFEGIIDGGLKGLNFVFDNAGRVVIASSYCDVSAVQTSNGLETPLISTSSGGACAFSIICVQWSPNRQELCMLVEKGLFDLYEHAILRYDAATGQMLGDLIPFSNPADPHQLNWETSYFCFGPDGDLYAPNSNRDVNRFDGVTGGFVETFVSGSLIPTAVRHLVFSPDGEKLYVTVSGAVIEFDTATRARTGWFTLATSTPAFCSWISSDWIERQIISGVVSKVPRPRPEPRIPKTEHRFPNFPINPLDVLAAVYRQISDGSIRSTEPPSREAVDATVKYSLRVLSGMLSDRRTATAIDRALAETMGRAEDMEMRQVLEKLRQSAHFGNEA